MNAVRVSLETRTVEISDLIMLKDAHHFTHTLPTETLFKVSARFPKLKITCFFKNKIDGSGD